ncbi:unnamed protein product [Dicrocoelium dendriticum]|nr:unnamed protein product [Dicrocoelium dendriticum]
MDHVVTPARISKQFENALAGRVEEWLHNPGDVSPMPIRLSLKQNVLYQLVHLKIGWRSTIPEDTPVVIFGVTRTRSVSCYYQSDVNSTKTVIGTSGNEFLLIQGEDGYTFELIRPMGRLTDTGIYHCISDSCSWCNPQRELIVLPLRTEVHILMNVLQPLMTAVPTESYSFLDEEGHPYTYPGQSFYVRCTSRTDRRVNIPPRMCFHSVGPVLTTEFVGNHTASPEKLQSLSDAVYVTHSLLYRITIASDILPMEHVQTTCIFSHPQNMPIYDLNEEVLHKQYNRTRYVQLRALQKPRILDNMVATDYAHLTRLLISPDASAMNALIFSMGDNQARVEEGIVGINYTVMLGQPMGWSGVYTVHQHTDGLVTEACDQIGGFEVGDENETRKASNGFDARFDKTSITQSNIYAFQFRCFLQLRTVSVVLFAMHSTLNSYDSKISTLEFLNSVKMMLDDSIRGTARSSPKTVAFPSYTDGSYRLARTYVGWHATIEVGTVIQMLGRLAKDGRGDPVCFYSSDKSNWNPTNISAVFQLRILKSMKYFILHKPTAQLNDSGWYRCKLDDCPDCATYLGMFERQLVVIPDRSILQMRLQLTDELSRLAQTCGLGDTLVLQPQTEYLLSCTHSVPAGFPQPLVASAGLHFIDDDRWVELKDRDTKLTHMMDGRTIQLNRTMYFTLPTSTSDSLYTVELVCVVQFDEFSVQYDMRARQPGRTLTENVTAMVTHRRLPEFHPSSIETDEPSMTEALQSASAGRLDRKSLVSNLSRAVVWEGPVDVAFRAYTGSPPGWTFVRVISKWNHTLWAESCLILKVKANVDHTEQEVRVRCIMRPEHVALVLIAAHVPGTRWNRSVVEAHATQVLLTNLSDWMGLQRGSSGNDQWSTCYNAAYRITTVQVQWNATVLVGHEVVMYGHLGNRREDQLNCRQNGKPLQHHNRTMLRLNPVSDYFTLTITDATYSDTGMYECRPVDMLASRNDLWGLGPRLLQVMPDSSTAANCSLTADAVGKEMLRNGGSDTNGLNYLLAGEYGYVRCMFEKTFTEFYRPVYTLEHRMLDVSTGRSEPVEVTQIVVHPLHINGMFTVQVYKIEGLKSKLYRGPLTASCKARVEFELPDQGSPITHIVSCQMTYAVLEAANGELLIETLSKDYDSQPVPLGTEFKCVGGYGSPPLGHGWTLSDNDWFDVFSSTLIRDNLSATHHGQWVGPKHTFTDQPVNGLVIKGDRLIIPTDDRYRGMSYAYTCWGNNSFGNKVWSIRKTIHFTVMICPMRFVPLDLTVLLSSRLLSRCTLEGNPDREIQFYGHFYLRLIQQLIMGLPHGPTQTRFHFIRDDIFSHNASDSFAFTAFTQQLSREQLLRAVNPNGTKPKTDPVGCGALPIIVDSVIRHLVALHHFPLPGREYVLLLPFDDFTDTRITNETKSLLSVLLQSNLSTVLASTVGQGVHGSAIIHTLEELFSTTRTINLLPNFSGDTHCLKCHPRLEAETLRIARDELFNTICEATGITRPDSCPAPTLRFAIPTRHWYSGLQLGVTCTADLSRPFRGQTATGVAICLTNGTMLKELEQSTPNVQQLMKACIQELANDVTRSISAPNEFSVSAQLKLQNRDDESSHLMCYQRQGDTDPQVSLTSFLYYTHPP